MSKIVDGGIATAYGAAVRGGYQGTYEQFCMDLAELAKVLENLTGLTVNVTTLAEGSQATGSYADGILSLGIPKGDTGNGISSMVLNQDYTLTVNYTDGTSWTSGSIRGETGATPNLSIGTVSTLTPGSQATAQITGTAENPVLNLGIPQGAPGELTAASMAPVYSASSTYAVGDYVIHDGQLYRCTTAITTAEAWTAVHWEAARVAEDVSDLNRQISDETTGLDTKAPVIINTASGAIASFNDGADSMPIRKLVAQIEPVQDLHGYDHPWPAGGRKNKLVYPYAYTTPQTINGVTFTPNADGTVTANGTATAGAAFTLRVSMNLPDGNYVFSGGFQAGIYVGLGYFETDDAPAETRINDNGGGVNITTHQGRVTYVQCIISRGMTANNLVFKPMIRLATETDATFAPYSNECPISGWTGAEIKQTGVNLWDEQWELGQIDPYTGEPTSSNDRIRSKNFIRLEPSTTFYAVSDGMGSNDFRMCFYDKYKNFISVGSWQYSSTFTTPANAYYGKFVRVNTTTYNNNISINYPATDTTYHPYTGNQISVTFPSEAGTVYGGTLTINPDKTGTLVVDRVILTNITVFGKVESFSTAEKSVFSVVGTKLADGVLAKNTDSEITSFICNRFKSSSIRDSVTGSAKETGIAASKTSNVCYITVPVEYGNTIEEYNSWLEANPTDIVCDLVTPITYQLTESEISGILSTLYGTNNIWADTGDIAECEYQADTKLYIDGKIAEAIAAALNA